MRKEKKGVFASVYIVGLLAFLYIPILIMIAYSFNSSEISSIWGGFSTEWYKVLFSRHDVRNALLNTLEVSVPATVISIVLATVGVIGFYKYDFKGKKIIDSILYLPAVVPPLLLGIALLSLYNILGIKLGTMTIISHSVRRLRSQLSRARWTDLTVRLKKRQEILAAANLKRYSKLSFRI